MIILGIDPGDEESAWVTYDTEAKKPLRATKEPNGVLLKRMCQFDTDEEDGFGAEINHMAIEMIASYGMPVGKSVFDTCVWIGRFIQAWIEHWALRHGCSYEYLYRKDVKMLLCGTTKAKDGNVRQAIMDRYGSTREKAIGKKKTPGPLYGVTKDMWSALGVAITAHEMERDEDDPIGRLHRHM
jgi:hypothetical protein